jgi:hypothetical protein
MGRSRVLSWLLGLCLLAASAALLSARAQPADWPSFERRVQAGAEPDYATTRARMVDYYHRRDQPVDAFATLVDSFLDFLDAELIPVSPDRRYKVFVSATLAEQQQDARRLFTSENSTPQGAYHSGYDVVATHAMADPGTITSLLLYPIMREQVPGAPPWARTAIATFFERVYGYPADGDRVVVRVGYHNPSRIAAVAGCLTQLDLTEIIANPDYADGDSHFPLVAGFLWQNRKLKTLAERLHDGDLRGQDNPLAAAFERPMSEIAPLWQDYLKSVDAAWFGIGRTPASGMFDSIDAFDAALAPVSAQPSWPQWFLQRVVPARLGRKSCPIRERDNF